MSARPGRLFLVPNTLDLGVSETERPLIESSLSQGVIARAATLAYWVAENAKTTRAFLKRVDAVCALTQPLQAINIAEIPRPDKGRISAQGVDWNALLKPALHGHDMGLLSEAGLPAVADPGAGLVQAAHAAGIGVQALSGPSAMMLALAASGLQGQCFAFVGYLPVDSGERAVRIKELESLSKRHQQTQLLIETPYRNTAVWNALVNQLQSTTWLSVSCGLTLSAGFSMTRTVAQWKQQPLTLPNDTPAVFCFLSPA